MQTRIKKLEDAWGLLKFLVTADEDLTLDDKAAKKNLKDDAVQPLTEAINVLEGVDDFTTDAIEKALSAKLIDELDLKPRKAYGALRVAVSGEAISPPLFESMELLGKESTLNRLRSCLAQTPWASEPAEG